MAYTGQESPHSLSAAEAADSEEHSASHEWAAFRIRPGMTRDEIDQVSVLVANFPGTPDLAMAKEMSTGFDLDPYTVQELVEIHKQQIIERFVKRFSKRKTDLDASEERERDTAGARRWEAVFETLYKCPVDDGDAAWQYEHIRSFTKELSGLAVALNHVCTRYTCPQMKATDEWMYLCAAHKQPQECSAIDYIIHTLDGTAALLNSNKWFPSRSEIPQSSLKYFQSITRRLYRILSHCYFHHREVFYDIEERSRLCLRFVTFAKTFDLIPPKLLIIPSGDWDSPELWEEEAE